MKEKTILLFLLPFLLVLPLVSANYTIPTITIYDNITELSEVGGSECIAVGVDGLYCLSPEISQGDFYLYNITTKNLSYITSGVNSESIYLNCEYYNDYIYCIDYTNSDARQSNKISLDGTEIINLSYPYIDSFGNQYSWGCDLRPITDEIYCWNSFDGYSGYIQKYDISEDSWTILKDVYTDYSNTTYNVCSFRNNNEFWCPYGGDSGKAKSNQIMVYKIDSNISYIKDTNTNGVLVPSCRWFEDILYCYGGDTDIETIENMSYYNPSTNESGYITSFPYGVSFYGGCDSFDNIDYCFGGYSGEWDYLDVIYKIEWEQSCTENWTINLYSECFYPSILYNEWVCLDQNECGTEENKPENCSVTFNTTCDFCNLFPEDPLCCIENWTTQYINGLCLQNNTFSSLKYYEDINECGTFEELPLDNSTITYEDCVYSTEYQGTYNNNDIVPIIINGLGIIGVFLISLTSTIVLIYVYLFVVNKITGKGSKK